jgi:hypothetical protein
MMPNSCSFRDSHGAIGLTESFTTLTYAIAIGISIAATAIVAPHWREGCSARPVKPPTIGRGTGVLYQLWHLWGKHSRIAITLRDLRPSYAVMRTIMDTA